MIVGRYRLVISIFLKSEYWTSVLFWSWSVRFIIIVALLYIRWFFHHLTRLSGSGGCVGRFSEVILTFVFPAASSSLSSSDMGFFLPLYGFIDRTADKMTTNRMSEIGVTCKRPQVGTRTRELQRGPNLCTLDARSTHWANQRRVGGVLPVRHAWILIPTPEMCLIRPERLVQVSTSTQVCAAIRYTSFHY